jgi:hypothetical protein
MARPWSGITEEQILDCSSISIQYQPNGLANISFTIYKSKGSPPPFAVGSTPGSLSLRAGGVQFEGWITSVGINQNSEVDADEYRISAVGVGCKV